MAQKRRTRQQIAAEYGTTVRDIRPGESEEAYYKALAQTANKRLDRLVKASQKDAYRGILNYAYANAIYDIRAMTGNPDQKHFTVRLEKRKDGGVNRADVHAKINAVKRFLESPTSMPSATLKIYKKRTETLNRNMGTNFTWQEAARMFESKEWEKLKGVMGSETFTKYVAKKKQRMKKKEAQDALDHNMKMPDEAVQDIDSLVEAEGIAPDKLIKEIFG